MQLKITSIRCGLIKEEKGKRKKEKMRQAHSGRVNAYEGPALFKSGEGSSDVFLGANDGGHEACFFQEML